MKLDYKHFKVLDRHSSHLLRAYRDHTYRDLFPDIKRELYDVYLWLGYSRTNINCNSCILSVLTTLYCHWNRYKTERENNKLKNQK